MGVPADDDDVGLTLLMVAYEGGSLRNLTPRTVMFTNRQSVWELSALLAPLFKLPSTDRVVGLINRHGVIIPLAAVCRVPQLLNPNDIYKLLVKEADQEEEGVYPVSALMTAPGPDAEPGRFVLPGLLWEAHIMEVARQLTAQGHLTGREGLVLAGLAAEGDTVVLSCCRVADALGVEGGAAGYLASVLKVVATGTVEAQERAEEDLEKEEVGIAPLSASPLHSAQVDMIELSEALLAAGHIEPASCLSLLNRALTLDESMLQVYSTYAAGGSELVLLQSLAALATSSTRSSKNNNDEEGGAMGSRRSSVAVSSMDRALRRSVLLQALAVLVGSTGNSGEKLSSHDRLILERLIETEHDLVVTAFEEYRSNGDLSDLCETLYLIPEMLAQNLQEDARPKAGSPGYGSFRVGSGNTYDDWETVEGATTVDEDGQRHAHRRYSSTGNAKYDDWETVEGSQAGAGGEIRGMGIGLDSFRGSAVGSFRVRQPTTDARNKTSNSKNDLNNTKRLWQQYGDESETVEGTTVVENEEGEEYANGHKDNGDYEEDYNDAQDEEQDDQEEYENEDEYIGESPIGSVYPEQLRRVVSTCALLLRLRGDLSEKGEQALWNLIKRESGVLKAAVEAYSITQNFEDLTDTLVNAAEVEMQMDEDEKNEEYSDDEEEEYETSQRKAASGAHATAMLAQQFARLKEKNQDNEEAEYSQPDESEDAALRRELRSLVKGLGDSSKITQKQRVFLLAQLGRPITEEARAHYAIYSETRDPHDLFGTLMAMTRQPVPATSTIRRTRSQIVAMSPVIEDETEDKADSKDNDGASGDADDIDEEYGDEEEDYEEEEGEEEYTNASGADGNTENGILDRLAGASAASAAAELADSFQKVVIGMNLKSSEIERLRIAITNQDTAVTNALLEYGGDGDKEKLEGVLRGVAEGDGNDEESSEEEQSEERSEEEESEQEEDGSEVEDGEYEEGDAPQWNDGVEEEKDGEQQDGES